MKRGTLTGIGLGPGDPELISLKGYKALQNADLVFYPVTSVRDGAVNSCAAAILEQLKMNLRSRPLLIPMTGKHREKYYSEAYRQIKEEIDRGMNVAVVCEGDLLFYSTFGYFLKPAKADGIDCRLIPGIPAFIAAGSWGDQPVVDGNTGLQVIAKPVSFEQLQQALEQKMTLVVMKMSVLDGWYGFLKGVNRSFLYAERVGTADQFIATCAEELRERKIPYFSLILFYETGRESHSGTS